MSGIDAIVIPHVYVNEMLSLLSLYCITCLLHVDPSSARYDTPFRAGTDLGFLDGAADTMIVIPAPLHLGLAKKSRALTTCCEEQARRGAHTYICTYRTTLSNR